MEGYDKYENYQSENNATSSGVYENYDSSDSLSPYEMLNQMKAWNKAVYIYVDDIDGQTKAQLSVLADRITAEVHDLNSDLVSYIDQTADAITLEVDNLTDAVITQFQIQDGQISSKVASTDYNGNRIATLINQTSTTVTISASKINLQGYVTVTSLQYGGTTTIHGNQIQTGTLYADKLVTGSITGTQIASGAITASEIASNTITASEIASGAIYAGAIQSNAIQSYHISAGAITAGAIQAGAIQAYHIQAGAISADMIQTGYLSANRISGGTISGVNINVDSNVTLGRTVYFGNSGLYFISESGGDLNLGSFGDVLINGRRVLTVDDL